MKVVTHEESAAQQIFAKSAALVIGELPVPDLDTIHPWPVENLVTIEIDHLLNRARVQAREAADALHELAVGLGVIDGPSAARAPVAAVRTRGIVEPGKRPFRLFVVVGRQRRGIVFVGCVLAETRLKGRAGGEGEHYDARGNRYPERHADWKSLYLVQDSMRGMQGSGWWYGFAVR